MRDPNINPLFILILIVIFIGNNDAATVTNLSPKKGSLNGGTRITISGTGFAKNQFNFGSDSNVGNGVVLYSGTQTYPCTIHKDGCTETQIMCYTAKMPAGKYTASVSVDGTKVPDANHCANNPANCVFEAAMSNTPTITGIKPRSGPPGTIVNVTGRIVTNRYGSNMAASSNGLTNKLTRVYIGGQKCEVMNVDTTSDPDDFYGIGFVDESNTYGMGNLSCKIQGTYIGNQNLSFLVDGEFGRSQPDLQTLLVSGDDEIAMFQTYAVITSVSPNSGSTSGGTKVVITGENFDTTDAPLSGFVGGVPCATTTFVSTTQAECITPAQPSSVPAYQLGNRGWKYESWSSTYLSYADLAEALNFSSTASDYSSSTIDEAKFEAEDVSDNFTSRASGYFVPKHSGDYRFYIKADDSAKLYFSQNGDPSQKVNIANCRAAASHYKKFSGQESSIFSLTAGTGYYLEVLHSEFMGRSSFQVSARLYPTTFSEDMTGSAVNEKQSVNIDSTVVHEVQDITPTGFSDTATSYTPEKQTVTISNINANSGVKYRLKLFDAYTELLDATADSVTVAEALNRHPLIAPGTVDIAETAQADGYVFVITFNTDLGNLPTMTYILEPTTASLGVAIAQTQNGNAGKGKIWLQMDGVVAPSFSPVATATQVKTALNGLFGYRCPKAIGNPTSSTQKFFADFESGSPYSGEIVNDVECFCGRQCNKNPFRIYEKQTNKLGISLTYFPKFCLAYKGEISETFRVKYTFTDSNLESITRYSLITGDFGAPTSWNYKCLDLQTLISAKAGTGSTGHRVDRIDLYRDGDIYVDAIQMSNVDTTTDPAEKVYLQRQRAAQPLMKAIEVTSPTSGQYRVDLAPNDCANNLPLLGLAGASASVSNLVTSSSATFSLAAQGGSVSLATSRVSPASPPVRGTARLTFGSTTVSIPATSTDKEVQDIIRTIPNIGNINVTHDGDCAKFTWKITFQQRRGDQPSFQVDGSSLTGNSVSSTLEVVENGSLYYDPLPGSMIRQLHSKPQVMLMSNSIPTMCTGNCQFEWSAAQTPAITAISPSQGTLALSTSAVITGTGFSTVQSENHVTIGGVVCTVTAATTTSITCNVGNGPTGTQNVNLVVDGVGTATGVITFNYVSNINSIAPSSGSLGGGTVLTLSGYGFSSAATVTVGGNNCPVQSSQAGEIICSTPASASAGPVAVVVTQYGSTLSSTTQFTYDNALTATITASSVTTTGVLGGSTIVLTGTGFGASASCSSGTCLKIGDVDATVSSYSDTSVTATLPPQSPGSYPIRLIVGTNGYAQIGAGVSNIEYKLTVTKIYPNRGSIYGGTKVTVTGQGFGTDKSILAATIGGYNCTIEDPVTDTKFVCTIVKTGQEHIIDNQGTSQKYGIGFAWNPPLLSISVGDTVKWNWWMATQLSSTVKFGICETSNSTATSCKANGFGTGATKASSGTYSFEVPQSGYYYYWSGYWDSHSSEYFRGVFSATERSESRGDFSLSLNGYEATYDTNSGVQNPSYSGSCAPELSPTGTCSSLSGGTANKFHFDFLNCMSGSVTSVSLNEGSSEDIITLTGSGFATTSCQNEVTVGSHSCVIQSATTSQVTCKVDANNNMVAGDLTEFDVRISNRGNSILKITDPSKRKFRLQPHISAITPSQGSKAGGTLLTINGGGFPSGTSDVQVLVDGFACTVQSVSYASLTCLTPNSGSYGTKTVQVYVTNNGNTMESVCRTNPNGQTQTCEFTYASALTPDMTSVTPTTVDGSTVPTTVTISGINFGTDSSKTHVTIGGISCTVQSVTDTSITCSVGNIPVGNQAIQLNIDGKGSSLSTGNVAISSQAMLTSVSPTTGSTNGGTILTISGNGFVDGKTSVTLGSSTCSIVAVSLSQIKCRTPAGLAGAVNVGVTSDSQTYSPTLTFTYDAAATPIVTSASPSSGNAGDSIVVTGSGFSTNNADNNVTVDGAECTVTASQTNQITCTLGTHAVGTFPLKMHVAGIGDTGTINFMYQLAVTSINPSSGSLGGNQQVTIQGSGFDISVTTVTICGETCEVAAGASQTSSSFICLTPPSSGSVTATCDVIATAGSVSSTLSNGYTYDASLTPSITSVTPSRGGTGGGTTITIAGSGFGSVKASTAVTIGGITCDVQTVTDTQITCITGARTAGSIKTKVNVEISGNGIATQTNADFYYVDVWSSPYTWGGNAPPAAGEIVEIPQGQTILLDNSTATLEMLIIRGTMIFDEVDLELNAKYILIVDGGALQIGTEAEPFQHKATITMHGEFRSSELPIYGSKVLAVRNGTLDMHGIPTPVTWTFLSSTASAGATQISLQVPVNWKVGDMIVLPTTGHRHKQSESETRTITAISADKQTLTLDSALTYNHVAVTETYGSKTVELRGEVGLLSHNIVFRGSSDPQWNDLIPKCEAGFDTGEFTTQTCFQGRFGEEMGSDQFGGHILVHAPEPNREWAIARIEYVEVTHAGQAFRLGRYPIHFHLNGDMSSSYVRGCGIHHTFNRAVNIHGTHNTLVEHTVLYNVMGGSFFLEDGIETNNTFQYNLAVFVISSTSLLNDDITPACFWVTNPNNIIQHNHAAGGTHFGFWYRMHEHPDGPSYDPNVCPQHVPLGVFYNNTAHSMGWFGLWIFQEYHPRVGGSCSSTADHAPAVYDYLTAWNCEKGAEAVNSGALQFKDFVLVNNEKAGYEGKLIISAPLYTSDSYMVDSALIVARSSNLEAHTNSFVCTKGGLILPYGKGMVTKNTVFYNFDSAGCSAITFTLIDGTCKEFCGGFTYWFYSMTFNNSPKKTNFFWKHIGELQDKDGTLLGSTAGSKLVATTADLPSSCVAASADYNQGVPTSICPPTVKFHRFAFMNTIPEALLYKYAVFTNQYGIMKAPFATKRLTHKPGWVAMLVDGEKYSLAFENALQVTNISYQGTFYSFDSNNEHIQICHKLNRIPDRFFFDGKTPRNQSELPLDINNNINGDWYYENSTSELCYMVAGKKVKRRAALGQDENDRTAIMMAYKCYYKDCELPPDPDKTPPSCARPSDAVTWSNSSAWSFAPAGYGGNYGNNQYGLPLAGDKVLIPSDIYMVMDQQIPSLDSLEIQGTLELDHGPNKDRQFTISVTYLYILGGRLVIGCEEANPFEGTVQIILRGTHATPDWAVTEGPNVGSKAIGVFGGLELHGKDKGVQWTQLAQTVSIGSNTLVLKDEVNWSVNDEIVVTSTSYNMWESETFKIQAIAGDKKTLTLNASFAYQHIALTETLSTGETYTMAAEVGCFTRNIKIIGEDYTDIYKDSFGGRVLVGVTADATRRYTGYASISNVEFYRMGQYGWDSKFDPRFSVTFLDTGTVSNIKPSYVKKSTFRHNFSPAIGLYATTNLEVQDNIIHHTVGPGIKVFSTDSKLRRNLINLNIWPGSYQDRSEAKNINYDGAIEAMGSQGIVLQGNHMSGAERAGYHGEPEPCSGNSEPWMDNVVHTAMIGVGIYGQDSLMSPPSCIHYSNYTIWKCYDFGLFYVGPQSLETRGNQLIDNGVGLHVLVYGPSALSHLYADKYFLIEDSLFVGTSPAFDCTKDIVNESDDNINLSGNARAGRIGGRGSFVGGRRGFDMGTFAQASNNCPEKPFNNIMSYPAISGRTNVKRTTFAHFKSACGYNDFAVSTPSRNDDLIHPLTIESTEFDDVPEDNKVHFTRPNVGKVNPSDCVDMDCDGLKKAMIQDLDGTFLGSVGYVLAQSEYEWDGDPRRGLGDYRIPKAMLTDPSGRRLSYNEFAKYKGIIRDTTCTYKSTWQAHKCTTSWNYRMLIIENMDSDTETRRLSPIGLLGWSNAGDGYIDLINGPQDHGWCAGYTCQKRLSTFPALVALGRNYTAYYTSVAPQTTRYFLLHAGANDAIRLATFYKTPNRLDVYHNGNYIIPKNGQLDNNGNLILSQPTTPGQYMPDPATDVSGANYIDRDWSQMNIIIKGPEPVEVVTTPVIVVGFNVPTLTLDQFFGPNLLNNLATFLGVDPSKVRTMNVVSGVSKRRRKRSGSNTMYYVEVGDGPCLTVNCTQSNSVTSNLNQLFVTMVNEYQMGNLADILNITLNGISVQEALPPTTDPVWQTIVQSSSSYESVLKIPQTLSVQTQAVPGTEGNVFTTQPKLQFLDASGNPVTILGASTSPWQVQVSLRAGSGSNPLATLSGNTTVTFVNGWANFTNLALSHLGSGYILDFDIIYPTNSNFTVASDPLTVNQRPLKGTVVSTGHEAYENSAVSIEIEIRDSTTDQSLSDIAWNGHTWTVTASLTSAGSLGFTYSGSLSGTLTSSFNAGTGRALLNNLVLDQMGAIFVTMTITSSPSDYNFTVEQMVNILPAEHSSLVITKTSALQFKFDISYAVYGNMYFYAAIINQLSASYKHLKFYDGSVSQGSVIITVNVGGNTTSVQTLVTDMCDSITAGNTYTYNGQTFTMTNYMMVDGSTYYGVSCAASSNDAAKIGLIVGIVLGILILIAIIAAVVFWRCKVYPKTKTHRFSICVPHSDVRKFEDKDDIIKYLGTSHYVENVLWREDTFQSLREKSFTGSTKSPMPPMNTRLASSLSVESPVPPLCTTPEIIAPGTPRTTTFLEEKKQSAKTSHY